MITLVVCLLAMLAPLQPAMAAPAARDPDLNGIVGYATRAYGPEYLAMRLPRGTIVHVCGPAGCVTATVNDYGPSRRLHPDRIADLSWVDFGRVCGSHAQGLCPARATVVTGPIKPPATDTEG